MKSLAKLCAYSLFLSAVFGGCASNKNLAASSETESVNNGEYAIIHLIRRSGIGGSGSNQIVVDIGEIYGDTGNLATAARKNAGWFDILYMSGELANSKTGTVVRNPWKEIGSKEDLCGIDVSEFLPPHNFKRIKPKFKFICPKISGSYSVVRVESSSNTDLEDLAKFKSPIDKILAWAAGKVFEKSEFQLIEYNYQRFTAVGEIANNSEIVWKRPAGMLSLRIIGCNFTCGISIGGFGYGIDYHVSAGQDYYLYMDELFVIGEIRLTPRK